MANFGDFSANQYWGMAQNLSADAQQQQHVQMPQGIAAPFFAAPANFAGGQHYPVAYGQQHPGAFGQQPQQWEQAGVCQPYMQQQVQQPRHRHHHHQMAMPVAMQPFNHQQHQQAWLQSVAPQQYQQHQQLYYGYRPYQGQPMRAPITTNPRHHQYYMAHQGPAAAAPSFQHQASALRLEPDFFSPVAIPPEQDLISAVAATIPLAPPNPSEDAYWRSAASALATRQGHEVLFVPDSPPRPAPHHQDDVLFVGAGLRAPTPYQEPEVVCMAVLPRPPAPRQQHEAIVVQDSPPCSPRTIRPETMASSAGVAGGLHQEAGASQEPETSPAPRQRVVNPRKVDGVGSDKVPRRMFWWEQKGVVERAEREAREAEEKRRREEAEKEAAKAAKVAQKEREKEEKKKAKAAERAEAKKRKRASDESVEEGGAAAESAPRPKKARKSKKEQASPAASEEAQLPSPPVSEEDDFDALTAAMEAEFLACEDFEEVDHAPPPPQSAAAAANTPEAPLGAGQTLSAPSAEAPAALLAPEQISASPSANASEALWAAEQTSAAAAANSPEAPEDGDDDYDDLFEEKEPVRELTPVRLLHLPGGKSMRL
ncbi:hypothetical protein H2201_006357 [Coniosporium apollinis]|uniref:Uncharacterized protein n=1 Tax=Coniosporium apollinis TaxID=61459 RepID=A0ABQ9NQQ9_9PEZI|nr:hypothetical protein H2201_006357 [Coniosporium apollinis]